MNDREIVGSFKREWRSDDGFTGGVEVEHVTRCETCWALVLVIDAEEHDRFHEPDQRG